MTKVIVTDYDECWARTFERLRAQIWPHLRDVATSIEHVGSTSVPGLAAKPIIDMTIVVPTAEQMPIVIQRLAGIGYAHRGDLGVTGRQAFSSPPDTLPHHLYACIAGCDALRNHLAVRDHLRSHPAAARSYSALKKELAARYANDIDGYVEGKTNFILSILAQAGFTDAQMEVIEAINRTR